MSLRDDEFRVLRQTIAVRGTVRMVLVPVTLFGWALLAGALVIFSEWPIAALLSLGVLVGGFEAIHALHVGVERLGRYIQVYYETETSGPRWESTAMRLGPGLPGGGVDPLFTVLFVCATLANLITVFIPPPPVAEAALPLILHSAFIVRVVRVRRAAARQRGNELEMFKRVRAEGAMPPPASPSH
jgi:hypothetical protein